MYSQKIFNIMEVKHTEAQDKWYESGKKENQSFDGENQQRSWFAELPVISKCENYVRK